MRITYEHRFAAPLDAVVAMMGDEDFAKIRACASGAADCDVLVDHETDGSFTVVMRRTVPANAIPMEFRALVGSSLEVRYTEVWSAPEHNGDPTDREGTFALEIPGTPGHARGAVVLRPDGDGTAFGLAGDVFAPVPIVGAVVERAVASAIEQALPAELAAADAWLAAR
ncbi:MAG: DUF2505 domain-containing protein [Demequinaceae bacterium]|nr:DUF2505 domain-containing protein [Demequinaceae bacterium]